MSTDQAKKKSVKVRIMEAMEKKGEALTLEELYKVIGDKPKSTVRGVLNINVGKVFDRTAKGKYDLKKEGEKDAQPTNQSPAEKPATSAAKQKAPAAKPKPKSTTPQKAKPSTSTANQKAPTPASKSKSPASPKAKPTPKVAAASTSKGQTVLVRKPVVKGKPANGKTAKAKAPAQAAKK